MLGLCVERMNELENAPNASGPTPKFSPKRIDPFNRLLQLFDQVMSEDLIIPRIDPVTKEAQLEIKSSPEHHDAIWEIKQLLGLDQNLEVYHVNSDFLEYRGDTISIRSRSLMSIFFYLSHNVDTPKDHKAAGLVTVTRNQDGSEFDWGKTAGGSLFHIRQSEKQPDMAFVAIPYRGQWFYLADNDLESKSTFMLLTQLFRLQAGAAKSAGPTLNFTCALKCFNLTKHTPLRSLARPHYGNITFEADKFDVIRVLLSLLMLLLASPSFGRADIRAAQRDHAGILQQVRLQVNPGSIR